MPHLHRPEQPAARTDPAAVEILRRDIQASCLRARIAIVTAIREPTKPTCLPDESTIIRTTGPPATRRQRQPPLTRPPPPRSQAGGFARGVRAAHPNPKTCPGRLAGREAYRHTGIQAYRQTDNQPGQPHRGKAAVPGPGARSMPAWPRAREPWLLPPATITGTTERSLRLAHWAELWSVRS